MGLFTKDIDSLGDAFIQTIETTYYAENQIAGALPTMIDKASSPDLKQALSTHLRETEGQISRLENIFSKLDRDPSQSTCKAIDGILAAGQSMMGNISDEGTLDAAIIASSQMVEHYEIAQYGTLAAWAKALGHADIASILEQTLDEEKSTDLKLTGIAEAGLGAAGANAAAARSSTSDAGYALAGDADAERSQLEDGTMTRAI